MENKLQSETIPRESPPPLSTHDLGTSWVSSAFGIIGSGMYVVGFSFALRTIGLLIAPESSGALSYVG